MPRTDLETGVQYGEWFVAIVYKIDHLCVRLSHVAVGVSFAHADVFI